MRQRHWQLMSRTQKAQHYYDQGYAARMEGARLDKNPYKDYRRPVKMGKDVFVNHLYPHVNWQQGWRDAADELAKAGASK